MNKKEAKEITIYDLPGVGAATAEKLKEAGYETLMAIAVATPGEITELSGLGEAAARKIINFARNSMSMGFETGEEVMKKRDNLTKLSTGSKNLDTLFGGGVETGSITETFGAFGSGKCIEKDAEVLYFNSSKSHLERMEDIYEKYKQRFGEKPMDGGYAVEVPPVNVLGLTGNKLGQVRAKFLFREKVAKLYEIITKRGRKLRVTGPHKLLSFNQNLQWKPAAIINNGDIIAYPKKLECNGECSFDKEDAYFLGMFVAEGSKKIDISNSSPVIINWIKAYVKEKFGFDASVWKDNQNEVHYIGLRKASKKILGDLADCTSENKFVPPELLQSSEEIVASFLAGYIDGDGHMGKDGFEATTKSKILANGLSYMFLRMGIAVTMKEKIVHGDTFWRLTVTSGDSEKLNTLPCKIKSGNYKHRNTSYGYSKDIIDYLRASYQETLGGNRGRHMKLIGKHNSKRMAYSYLTNSTLACQNMNEKTLLEVYNLFLSGKENVKKAISLAETLEDLDKESFLMLHELLPFAFNSFSQELGISKSTFQNYPQRGVPKRDKKTILKIKGPLLDKLNKIGKKLDDVLVVMKGIGYFNWDTIESIKEIEYNDYVYDFVVPEGHCFVGGNMPTILHNTSIAHQLAVNVQLPKEKGGGDGIAVWIDSESTFRPERIKQICADLGLDPLEALRNIRVVRVFNSDHQMLVAEKVEDLITKDKLPVRLVIVDSLMAHFRAEFCVTPDTKIIANPSTKQIQDCKENDKVLTHTGNFRKVLSKSVMNYSGEILNIKPQYGQRFNLTGDHAVFALKTLRRSWYKKASKYKRKMQDGYLRITDNGGKHYCVYEGFGPDWIKADTLEVGDYFVYPVIKNVEDIKSIRISDYLKGNYVLTENNQIMATDFYHEKKVYSEILDEYKQKPEKGRMTFLSKKYSLPISTIHQWVKGKQNIREDIVQVRNDIELSPECMRLLGYYLAEGSTNDHQIRFTFNQKEKGYIEDVKGLFKAVFGISQNKDILIGNALNVCFSGRVLAEFFRSFFGKNAVEKKLPQWVLYLPLELQKELIKGYWRGDGSNSKYGFDVCTASPVLAEQVKLILIRLGLIPTFRVVNEKDRKNPKYVVEVFGKGVEEFGKIVGVTHTILAKRRNTYNNGWNDGNYAYVPIREIARKQYSGELYNLEVEADHSYATNYCVLHNCGRGQLADRQQKLNKHMHVLMKMADMYNFAVYVTNQVMAKPDTFFGDPTAAIGGNIVGHNSQTRVYLRRGKGGTRVAKLVDSPHLPDGEAVFQVVEGGIKDA